MFPAVLTIALASCGLSGSAVDGPMMRYPARSYSGGQMDAEVRGVLEPRLSGAAHGGRIVGAGRLCLHGVDTVTH